jgi:hypothetical protein
LAGLAPRFFKGGALGGKSALFQEKTLSPHIHYREDHHMNRVLKLTLLLLIGITLAACGSGNSAPDQSQQAQIDALQAQLAAVQAQLSSVQAQGAVDSAAIDTAITSLTQTRNSLAQLVASGGADRRRQPGAGAAIPGRQPCRDCPERGRRL